MTEPKLPPHAPDAEQAVLGAALNSVRAYDAAAELIGAEDFYREDHRMIWAAIAAVVDSGSEPDQVSVVERLRRDDNLDRVGAPYVGELAMSGITANAKGYAAIIRDSAVRRGLIQSGQRIAERAWDNDGTPVNDLIAEADAEVCGLARAGGKGGLTDSRQIVKAAIERLEQAHESGSSIVGLRTGFDDLDRLTTGLRESDLVIVAGRPSMGKSAFGFNVARRVCAPGGHVAAFSGEMGDKDLVDRMAADLSGVPLGRIRAPSTLEDADWAPLTDAYGQIAEYRLEIDDTPGLTIAELRARARQMHRVQPVDAVVVDYLQLYRAPSAKSRENEISEISRGLKAVAKDMECPVIALSQLNRSCEQRQDKRPRMSDLRESGGIEQDADLILFVYRDEVYDDESPHQGVAEIIIGKQRNGPLGKVELAYLGDRTSFQPYTGPSFAEREESRPRSSKHVQFSPDRKSAAAGGM